MKRISLLLVMLVAGVMIGYSQGGPQRSVEERTKRVVDTLTTVFKLDKSQQTQLDSTIANYYRAQVKLRESMQQGGTFDRAEFDKLVADRDEKLKKVLNEEQFKKFKDEIEPAMRPRRGGGGGNN